MSKHVFLSPHFDDAVYSCGGTLALLHEQNHEVYVVTVMGGGLPAVVPQSPIVKSLHALWAAGDNPLATRQQEDVEAVASLSAQLIQLPVLDCIYRVIDGRVLYPDEASLWGAIDLQDSIQRWLTDRTALDAVLRDADILYAPLGVGQHVDHRLVRSWALELAREYPQVRLHFYTDFPYMKDSRQISIALTSVGVAVQPRWVHLTREHIDAKIAAIAMYASQISTFWKSTDELRQDVETTFRLENDLWGERYWIRA